MKKGTREKSIHRFALAAAGLASGAGYASRASETVAHSMTIYCSGAPGLGNAEAYLNNGAAVPGYAVVRHEREIDLERGRNEVQFTDLAGLNDPTSVAFRSLTDPQGTRVVEQNFQFDLVSTDKLLQKFVDRNISVEQARGDKLDTYTGTLLSTAGGLVLRQDDGSVRVVSHNSGITLPSLPGGLITRPTLVWDVAAGKGGAHLARVAY